ncbi:hypothetical protein [Aureibacter tunicatorum]|uniref:STAS/SEC14 domain-containing protein n=1 Tax=Aureibacter tunicatorum TaxID=866807 RepID=A0AAE3XIK9_9BACT|nr:hypothetical protein [Aureibacter tunicatorum]MDR6237095.1 hypothetical protein [Aureibacter tunicatorum]BDD06087.1 hypothetical protein AUTU_35700 [Aureibacter tunicatorum]
MTITHENEFVEVGYENDYGVIRYKKYCPDKEDREAMLALLEVVKEKKFQKHMANPSLMGVAPVETQMWIAEVIMPALLEAGGGEYYAATVIGKDAFATFAVKNMERNMTEEDLKLRFFPSEDEAFAWLEEVK